MNDPPDGPVDGPSETQLKRLQHLTMTAWWLLCLGLWLSVGALSLWVLRHEVAQARAYFTWAQVRYGLAHNRLPSLGLGLCVGLTVGILVSQSRHILFGWSQQEQKRLRSRLVQIRQQGPSHPLWRLVCGDRPKERL
ncbi:MAG: hypothetical protein AAGF66_04205 [Cyanobacteria bacterium P01_H01_bin.119]